MKCNVYRYAEGATSQRSNFTEQRAAIKVGLYKSNSVDPLA
jgi:hypothetical protein